MTRRAPWIALAVSGAAGLLGLLPGAAGSFDPLALLGWLALAAPAAGALCGALGVRPWPTGLAVPALWTVLLVWADLLARRDLPTPLWAACAIAGLFGLGSAAGALLRQSPWRAVGATWLATLVLAGAAFAGGLVRSAPPWVESHPRLAATLLDLSPVLYATDCAGLDWVHAHPVAYALSGVEWFPRRPWRGPLAGPALLVVGCGSALLLARRARTSAKREELEPPPPEPWLCASTSARSPRS